MEKDPIGEDEYITQLDNELVADGLPQNEINKLLKMAEQELQCDKECERDRKIKHFKKKWDYTKDLYLSLPNIISQNEDFFFIRNTQMNMVIIAPTPWVEFHKIGISRACR